ncbi:bacteriocin immunity protein [Pseudomonas cedrina subsp. fulgida]|nr:bacteriocin immunity protein [Pseudomonas cedrina subsp. fulgida]
MGILISEMTEEEFLKLVKNIYNDEYASEDEHTEAILEFKALAEHPAGSDLIFYPEPDKIGPEAIVKEVKEWRAAQGKTSFKAERLAKIATQGAATS